MFEVTQSDGEVPGRERKKRKTSRRSSILKKSPARFPLDDLNPNNDDTESRHIGGKHSRKSGGRRVSFAEKLQIKEFHNNFIQTGIHGNGDENQMLPMFSNQPSAQVAKNDRNIFNLFTDNPPSHAQEQDQGNFVLAPTFQRSEVNRPNDGQRRKRKSFDIFDYVDSIDEEETSDEDQRGILNKFNQTRFFENDEMEFTCHRPQTTAGEESFVDKTRYFDSENMEFTCPINYSIACETVNMQQETVEPIKKKRRVVESFCSDSNGEKIHPATSNEGDGHSNASLIAAKYESNKKELMESASMVLQGKAKPDPPSLNEECKEKTKSDPPSIRKDDKGTTKADPSIFHGSNQHIDPAFSEFSKQNIDDKENEVDAFHHLDDDKENIVDTDLVMLAQTGQSLLGKTNHDQSNGKVFDGHAFVQSLKMKGTKTNYSPADEKDLANKSIYKSEEWYQEMIERTDSLSHSKDDEAMQPLTNEKADETEITSQAGVKIGVRVADEELTEPVKRADEGVTDPTAVHSSKRARLHPDDCWKSNTSIISALLKLKEANTSVSTAGQGNPGLCFSEVPKGLNGGRNPTNVANKSICKSEEWYQQMVQQRTDSLSKNEDEIEKEQQINVDPKVEKKAPKQTGMSQEEESITKSIVAPSSKRARIDPAETDRHQESVLPFLKQLKKEKALKANHCQENSVKTFAKVPQKPNDYETSAALANKRVYESGEWCQQMIEKTDASSSDCVNGVRFTKVPQRPTVDTQSTALANKIICEDKRIYEETIENTVFEKTPLIYNQDCSSSNVPDVPQGKPIETASYLQNKENLFSSTANKTTTTQSINQAGYKTGKHKNNASSHSSHMHLLAPAVDESLLRNTLSEEMPEIGCIGPVSALVGKIESQVKSRREDMNATLTEQRATHPSLSKENSLKPEDPCVIPHSADYDAVITQDPVKADQLRLASATLVVEKPDQEPICFDGEGIDSAAEATMIISPPVDFQFKPSETYCIPKNDPEAFLNEVVEQQNIPGVGRNVELGKSYFKSKETFILPKAAENEAAKGHRFSIGDIQRKAKNRMSWISREKMIIASTPARGMETQCLNDISAIQEETVVGLTMIASEQEREDLVQNDKPQSLTIEVKSCGKTEQGRGNFAANDNPQRSTLQAKSCGEALQERANQVKDEQPQSLTRQGERYGETEQGRCNYVASDNPERSTLQVEEYGDAVHERGNQAKDDPPQCLSLQSEGCVEANQEKVNFAEDDRPSSLALEGEECGEEEQARDNIVAVDMPPRLSPPGLNQTVQLDDDKTLEARTMPDEFPESVLQGEMPDLEEQEQENNDKTIVPEIIQDFGKNHETETLLSLENDPAYRKMISTVQEEKAEMEANLAELIKVLEDKQLDLMAMEEIKMDIEKDRKNLDERATMYRKKEKVLASKATELEMILEKEEALKRENERLKMRAEELQKKIKEDSELRECFVRLIEISDRLLVWSLVEWSRSKVVFKFKFCGLMLSIDFEEIDQESYKTSDILQWNKKIKSIKFQNNKHNFRTKSSEFVSSRLCKQVAEKCLQDKYRTTKNLNKLLHEVSSMVIASKQLYADLHEVEVMNNLTVQDDDCLSSRFISPPYMLFTEFDLECRIKDGGHKIDVAVRHVFAKDRTEIFQEIVSRTKEGPMLFSRCTKRVKDFVFDAHRHYLKKPHKLTEAQLGIVDKIFASYS